MKQYMVCAVIGTNENAQLLVEAESPAGAVSAAYVTIESETGYPNSQIGIRSVEEYITFESQIKAIERQFEYDAFKAFMLDNGFSEDYNDLN